MDKQICTEKKEIIKSLIIISIVYLLSQGFILVLTGTWWDEKTWFFSSNEKMREISFQLGKPSTYYIMSFIISVPEVLGRFLIFIMYYLGTIGIYVIYRQIPFLSNLDATLMTLLYLAIPANDARAMRGVFPYTVGYFLFILAFCLLIVLEQKFDYKNIVFRTVVLFAFFCSFILNSNLVFYTIPLMYVLLYVIKNNKIKECYKYIDFVLLPFIYFIFKSKLFPAYGIYQGYNEVSLRGLLEGAYYSIEICWKDLKKIFMFWHRYIVVGAVFGFLFAIILYLSRRNRNRTNFQRTISVWLRVTLLISGILIMYLAIFPYRVVGQACHLIGVDGRSSILIPFGAAIIIYSLVIWVPLPSIRVFVCSIVMVCGICHFNYFYLLYQQDFYRQMDLIYELKENKDVLYVTKNILFLSDYMSEIDVTRFYSLNSSGREAFGDQSHFFMNGIEDYSYLTEASEDMYFFVNVGDYQMADYEIGRSNEIEAIIVYHDGLGIRDTVYYKLLELTHDDQFEKKLYGEKNLDVYVKGTEEFNKVLDSILQ